MTLYVGPRPPIPHETSRLPRAPKLASHFLTVSHKIGLVLSGFKNGPVVD